MRNECVEPAEEIWGVGGNWQLKKYCMSRASHICCIKYPQHSYYYLPSSVQNAKWNTFHSRDNEYIICKSHTLHTKFQTKNMTWLHLIISFVDGAWSGCICWRYPLRRSSLNGKPSTQLNTRIHIHGKICSRMSISYYISQPTCCRWLWFLREQFWLSALAKNLVLFYICHSAHGTRWRHTEHRRSTSTQVDGGNGFNAYCVYCFAPPPPPPTTSTTDNDDNDAEFVFICFTLAFIVSVHANYLFARFYTAWPNQAKHQTPLQLHRAMYTCVTVSHEINIQTLYAVRYWWHHDVYE